MHLYNGALQATEVLLLVLDHFIKGLVVVVIGDLYSPFCRV